MSRERAPGLIMQPLIRLRVSAAQWLLSPRHVVLNNAVRLTERREGRFPAPAAGADFHFQEAPLDLCRIIKRRIVIYRGLEA